jgi:hypothetical protein
MQRRQCRHVLAIASMPVLTNSQRMQTNGPQPCFAGFCLTQADRVPTSASMTVFLDSALFLTQELAHWNILENPK